MLWPQETPTKFEGERQCQTKNFGWLENIFKTQRSKSSIWRLSRLWVDSSTGFPDLHISGMEMWIKCKRTFCRFSEIFQCHCHLSHPLKLWVSAGKKTSLERSLGAAVMWNLDFKLDKFSTQVTQNDTTDSKLLNIIHTSPQYKYNWQIQIHIQLINETDKCNWQLEMVDFLPWKLSDLPPAAAALPILKLELVWNLVKENFTAAFVFRLKGLRAAERWERCASN